MFVLCISVMFCGLRMLFLVISRWLCGMVCCMFSVVCSDILNVCRLWLLMLIIGVGICRVCFSLLMLCIFISMFMFNDNVSLDSVVSWVLFSVVMISRMQLVFSMCVLYIWQVLMMKFLCSIGSVQVLWVCWRQVLVFWKKFILVSIDRQLVLLNLQLIVMLVGWKFGWIMFLDGLVFFILVIIVGLLLVMVVCSVCMKLCIGGVLVMVV